jgi:hypothetical protein
MTAADPDADADNIERQGSPAPRSGACHGRPEDALPPADSHEEHRLRLAAMAGMAARAARRWQLQQQLKRGNPHQGFYEVPQSPTAEHTPVQAHTHIQPQPQPQPQPPQSRAELTLSMRGRAGQLLPPAPIITSPFTPSNTHTPSHAHALGHAPGHAHAGWYGSGVGQMSPLAQMFQPLPLSPLLSPLSPHIVIIGNGEISR